MDAVVKHAATLAPVPDVTLGRYAAGTLLAVVVWRLAGAPPIRRVMLPAHLLRGVLIAATALMFNWSLTQLPFAEVMVLAFTAPLMIPVFAALLIGERLRGRALAAGGIGFLGVLVTVQGAPLFETGRAWGVAAVLGASVTYALSAIVLRARAAQDGAPVVTLLGAAIPCLLLAPVAITAAPPGWELIGWFAACGLLGNLGVQLLARAYARAEAQQLAVIEFSGLIWAALFGWLFFGESVRLAVWAGAALIIAACVWAARDVPGEAAPLPPG